MAKPEKPLRIARDGEELGAWSLAEVRELLEAGFLLPTDHFWQAGQGDWKLLSQLPPDATGETSRMTKALGSVADAAKVIGRGAVRAAQSVSSAADRQREQMTAATNRLLEGFLPRLGAQVQSALAKTSHTIESALRDEVFMRKLFGATYDCLPKPVTRFVTEEVFIAFCHKHRERLLGK